jgi:hypothetical protein
MSPLLHLRLNSMQFLLSAMSAGLLPPAPLVPRYQTASAITLTPQLGFIGEWLTLSGGPHQFAGHSAAALLACGLSAPAQAGPNRTWVSGHGTDSGGCALVAPCRTFAFALTQTAAGGEIDVLDPAGYGTVTITKAISIVNDGVGTAVILAPTGNAITINAGANDSVHLRGLTIEALGIGGGTGANGIQFNTGGNLAIENCVVRDFAQSGINIAPSTSSSFSVSNTIASNNSSGISVGPSGSAVVTGVLSKVTANNNGRGISVVSLSGSSNVTIVDSEASNNNRFAAISATVGVFAGAGGTVMVRNVVASYNGTGVNGIGLWAEDSAILRVAHSVVTGNGTGVSTSPAGTIQSYGDNDIDGNTNNNTGVLTPLPKH